MLAASGYKTKKDLKAAVGKLFQYEETSAFGVEFKPDGENAIVGPSARDRKWYATVTCMGSVIMKVS